ncbi:transposase domain-containing protein [Roseovarius sp. M141]|nr:transposase domain-containing protein [Roseovarius sp. M141]
MRCRAADDRGVAGRGRQAEHLDPQTYLAKVLARIHDHKINRPDELLPWTWAPRVSATDSQAA